MKNRFFIPKLFLVLAVVSSMTISCKDKEKEVAPQNSTENSESTVDETAIKVNPAHGMPGHTCELPVGAPLNSSNEKTAPVSELPSTSVSPIRVDQTPDINPPHGQPGHLCSVPVGAPLE